MQTDNATFNSFFSSLPTHRQAEILRDTARFYREERGDHKQADDLEHEAFLRENWEAITEGRL